MSNYLKPFVINQTDIQFILDQVTFLPLFDQNANIIVNWDGTGTVYDFKGNVLAVGGTTPTDQASIDAIALVGTSYQNFTDLSGTRDVSGFWNNLAPLLAHYGDTGQVFPRMIKANYENYVAQLAALGMPTDRPVEADLASVTPTLTFDLTFEDGTVTTVTNVVPYPGGSYSYTIETWNRTTTQQETTTLFVDGHHIFANLSQVETTVSTRTDFMVNDATGTHVAVPDIATSGNVTTLGPVTMSGGELDGMYHGFTTEYALAHQDYTVAPDTTATAEEGDTLASDGTAINIRNVIDYTPRMISRTITTAGVTYDTWANHQTMLDTDGVTVIPNPEAANHAPTEIYYGPSGEATVLDWGMLETVANGGEGQIDTQARLAASAGQNDHFIGSLNPGVSPSNGFFVLFGQFFDHGLDFIDKGQTDANGNNVTIKIALALDDPLYGMLGPDGQPVTEITINRATVQTVDGQGSEYINHVSPFIDQSQTYGSDVQRTNLLREWVLNPSDGQYHAGMRMLDGTTLATPWKKPDGSMSTDTLPTLNELRAHIDATGRDALTWDDIGNLRNRDDAGHVVAGTSGESLLLDMNPRFDTAHLLNAQGENAVETQKVLDAVSYLNTYGVRPGDSFGFNDNGVLTLHLGSDLPMGPTASIPAGTDLTGASALAGWVNFANFSIMQTPPGIPSQFVDGVRNAVSDILMASVGDHYIAGDGRANENFGLTSIHHVFHEEHNYQVDNLIDALHRQDIATNDVMHVKLHEFQVDTGHGMNAAGDYLDAQGNISWDQEKIFQGAKLIVEMEYQHAAVDQYARNVSPNIQEFVGYSPDKQPDVTLEYSQVAFRFGHSTLRETIDTIDPTHGITGKIMGYALHDAFLNPEMFGAVGPGAILLGMTHQQQNEVDEFVTPALNQGLLGQPLDLAAINIARGRDVGMPTLNDFREALGLLRYTSWNDFGQNMQHPSSLVNFIAAYAFDGSMDKAQAIFDLVDGTYADEAAGLALGTLLGWTGTIGELVSRAYAFLSGDETVGGAGTLAFNQIDTWLGGLAEIHQPGGLLGETFDLVFVTQIESLMDGDRFYYLYRLAGQQFGEEVANAQLKDLVERNSGLTHLNGNVFGYADQYVDLGAQKEVVANGQEALTTGNEHKYGDMTAVADGSMGVYSNGGPGNANDGHLITIDGKTYVQDTRLSADNPMSADYNGGNNAYALNDYVNLDGTPNSGAESNEVIVGTKGDDLIYAQGGDDTVYGEDGNDIIFGGYGIDRLYGGAGSDTIKGGDNPDLIDGGSGDDFLYGESSGTDINGADQIIGGSGNDYIDGGVGIDKLSAGSGDDRVYGGQDTDPFTHGGDGNDYVDGGSGGDILYGDNGDDVVVGGADQDQLFGNDGDDILRPGDPTGALTIGGDEVLGGDGVDVNDKGFDLIDFSDNTDRPGGVTFDLSNQQNPAVTPNGSAKQVQSFQIDGVVGSKSNDTIIGDSASAAGAGADASIAGNNWLIGGSGNDMITGGGGNDIIVGGSIRLDALIGKYNTTYDHNNNNTGTTEAEQLQDALYQGASHRVAYDDVVDNSGLLGHTETAMFDKHFTEMLRTEMFKDTVLGDGGVDGMADKAIYTGKLADYQLTALDAQGNVVDNPHLNWANVLAVKIEDMRTAADFLDANGAPLLDANGVPLVNEGTDLVIGVEQFVFSDQTIDPQAYFDIAPTLDLNYVPIADVNTIAADNFSGNGSAYGRGTGWTGDWVETDNNNPGNGQIQVSTTGGGGGGGGGNPGLVFDNGTGASIVRTISGLGGLSNATLSFTYNEFGFDNGETVTVQFAADGVNFANVFVVSGTSGNGTANLDLAALLGPGETFAADAKLQFVATADSGFGEYVRIDNIAITAPAATFHDGAAGNNNAIAYTENAAGVAITDSALVSDVDDPQIASATIKLRETIAGDRLNVTTLPGGIVASGNGTGTIILSGLASFAAYQDALAAITFDSTSDNPTNATRHIDVTVNDGLKDSAVATTTVTVTPVDDPTTATASDMIVTNYGTSTFSVADWMLLANDTDVDGARINNVGSSSGLSSLSHSSNSQTVTIRDNTTPGGSFTYSVVNPGPGVGNTAVTVTQDTSGSLDGTNGNDIVIGNDSSTVINANDGNDIIDAGGGNDTINAGAGDDVIVWNANNASGNSNNGTDGRDIVDGGANASATGDTFIVNGSNSSEVFTIFTAADWLALGGFGNGGHTLQNNASEIIITRGTNPNNASVIAELRNVEEIVINTGGGNDAVNVSGNFDITHLNYNTIHINDDDGGDTVDISGLTSDHRIVFNTSGNGHVVGNLRPQDVVNGASGATGSTGADGSGSGPVAAEDEDPSDDSTNRAPVNSSPVMLPNLGINTQLAITAAMLLANSSDADADPLAVANLQVSSGSVSDNGDGTWTFTPATDDSSDVTFTYDVTDGTHSVAQIATLDLVSSDPALAQADLPAGPDSNATIGTDAADVMIGASADDVLSGGLGDDIILANQGNDTLLGGGGDDLVKGGDGNDVIFGGDGNDDLFGGAGNDMIFGDAGNDRIFGDAGNDVIEGGSGNDTVYGGEGDDRVIATADDGDDVYWGDGGQDTLDYAAITANLTVDLGNGTLQHGSVTSTMSGTDTVFGFENVMTGSGNDTIMASAAVNVMDGGLGNDTFVFRSAADANHDVINGFHPGDKIDLSGIDADANTDGQQSFVLFAGSVFTTSGQITINHQIIDGVDHTIVAGNTTGGSGADFEIDVTGIHNLTTSDFSGVA